MGVGVGVPGTGVKVGAGHAPPVQSLIFTLIPHSLSWYCLQLGPQVVQLDKTEGSQTTTTVV